MILPASDEIHDLHVITLTYDNRVERGAFEHVQIQLDRHPASVDFEVFEQLGDREWTWQFVRFAIERDLHFSTLPYFDWPRSRWYLE